jgi:hypothetical protein
MGQATSVYAGGNIKVKIDGLLTGTVTNAQTIIFGVGIIGVADGEVYDATPPTSSNGYNSGTFTIDTATYATGDKFSLLVTITAHSSIAAGEEWKGYIKRLTATDTAVASAEVTGITVYE